MKVFIVVDLSIEDSETWFYWPLVLWGLGLLIHYLFGWWYLDRSWVGDHQARKHVYAPAGCVAASGLGRTVSRRWPEDVT